MRTQRNEGSALIIVILVMLVVMTMGTAALMLTSFELRHSSANVANQQVYEAAMTGANYAMSKVREMSGGGITPDEDQLAELDVPDEILPGYHYIHRDDPGEQGVYVDATMDESIQTIDDGFFQGLKAISRPYRVTSIAVGPQNERAMVMRNFSLDYIPIFQFAAFYDGDFELHNGPTMVFAGRIHSNSNVYIMSKANTKMYNLSGDQTVVTAAGRFYNTNHPNNPEGNGGFHFNYDYFLRVGGNPSSGTNSGDWVRGIDGPTGTWWRNHYPEEVSSDDYSESRLDIYEGLIKDRAHGVPKLGLPLDEGVHNIELIKMGLPNDTDNLRENKLFYQAALRIITVPRSDFTHPDTTYAFDKYGARYQFLHDEQYMPNRATYDHPIHGTVTNWPETYVVDKEQLGNTEASIWRLPNYYGWEDQYGSKILDLRHSGIIVSDTTGTGGSSGPDTTIIINENFDANLGLFSDGGADCAHYTGARAHSGGALNLQDDTSSSVSELNDAVDLHGPGYTGLTISFWLYFYSFENNEALSVDYYNGSEWQTIGNYAVRNSGGYSNDQFYQETIELNEDNYTFPSNMRLRFVCDASGNGDDVYIDDVVVTAVTGESSGGGGGDDDDGGPYTICHIPPGNPENRHTITVGSASARDAHLAHGDILGECPEPEHWPDDYFTIGGYGGFWDDREDQWAAVTNINLEAFLTDTLFAIFENNGTTPAGFDTFSDNDYEIEFFVRRPVEYSDDGFVADWEVVKVGAVPVLDPNEGSFDVIMVPVIDVLRDPPDVPDTNTPYDPFGIWVTDLRESYLNDNLDKFPRARRADGSLFDGQSVDNSGGLDVDAGHGRMTICHVPPGNPANAHTITISNSAWSAHNQNHPGDYQGECNHIDETYDNDPYQNAGYIAGVRVYNGDNLRDWMVGNFGISPIRAGISFISDRGIYVQGHYNANGVHNPDYNHLLEEIPERLPSAMMADAVYALSRSWVDARSYYSTTNRNAGETVQCFAMISGNNETDHPPTNRASGGVHNLKRYLEDWGGVDHNWITSIVCIYESETFAEPYVCCPFYSPPQRRWAFDERFLTVNGWPPLTPKVRQFNYGPVEYDRDLEF